MKTKILSILALLLTVTQGAWALDGSGTPEDPFIINSNTDWTTYVNGVNNGSISASSHVRLNANAVTGTTYRINNFQGTFDGNGYTITTGSGAKGTPMFPSVNGATIKNLGVGGTFEFSDPHKSALIGTATGNTTIENCKITANVTYTISSTQSGGFVGQMPEGNGNVLTVRGCVFSGSLTGAGSSTDFGGITYSPSNCTVTNCLFAPSSVSGFNMTLYNNTFIRGAGTVTNCYSTEEFNNQSNHHARSISAGTDVTSLAISGAGTVYNVSGITAYATGIKYNDVYYACNGESVSLTLSHGDKAGYAFNQYAVAGGGTLTAQTETSATLSMTDANQTINAQWTPTYTATFAAGNDNTGWTIDPASGVEGTTVTVSYSGENKVKSVTVQEKP